MPRSPSSRAAASRHRKQHGIHYTPAELAQFLARVTLAERAETNSHLNVNVLDPACGNGVLLSAMARLSPNANLTGYETDATTTATARDVLSGATNGQVEIHEDDFLERNQRASPNRFDVVITNPPYVRTQTLGAARSRALAARWRLTGRVDLYQAFVRAVTDALRPGGVLGLLTSNRFLSVQAGSALRALLRDEYELRAIYDLGDTRLFTAAVLPVIVVAVRRGTGRPPCDGTAAARFVRVYEEVADGEGETGRRGEDLFNALLDSDLSSAVVPDGSRYRIERGTLASESSNGAVWRLSRPDYDRWLARVAERSAGTFGDFTEIRVGIKTTADAVFVRGDWDDLPESRKPEPELLRPVITHREAARWSINWAEDSRRVLYPYLACEGKRRPISLRDFPKATKYLLEFEERLRNRRYLVDSGRQWYEIWVPHRPALWLEPKLVFPDISEKPRFALDQSGAIVQGDCYWMILKPGVETDWLWLMLAVANSKFIERFYDLTFHNKLYAGRRRFMTQYVRQFPVPRLDSDAGRLLVALARRRVAQPGNDIDDAEVNRLVNEAFGVENKSGGLCLC